MLYTDTDSLMYELKTEDMYKDILNDNNVYNVKYPVNVEFDNSDFPENHFLHSKDNKKKVETMKIENLNKIISKFVGLRSKLYSYKIYEDSSEYKKAKGIKGKYKEGTNF